METIDNNDDDEQDWPIVDDSEYEEAEEPIVLSHSPDTEESEEDELQDAILLSLDPEAFTRKRRRDEYFAALCEASGFDRHGRPKRPRLECGPLQKLIDENHEVIFRAIIPLLLVDERWDWIVDFFCVCRGLYRSVFRAYDAEKNTPSQSWLEKLRTEARPAMLRLRVIPDAYKLLHHHYGKEEKDQGLSFRRNATGDRVVFRPQSHKLLGSIWVPAIKCVALCDASFHVMYDTVLYVRELHCYPDNMMWQSVDYRQMHAGAALLNIKLEGRVRELMNKNK